MHILLFIVFLAAYVVYIWLSIKSTVSAIGSVENSRTFWAGERNVVLTIGTLFGFAFLLTGYFDWRIVAAYFFASQIGVVITFSLNGLLGSATAKWGARWLWAGFEFANNNQALTKGLNALAFVALVAYPVAIGVYYFGSSGKDLYLRIFQCTLCILYIPSFVMSFPTLIGGLASENLDTGTRTRVFITQVGSLFPSALILGLVFWSFGIAGPGISIDFGSGTLVLSPALMLVLLFVLVLLAIFVLPMLIAFLIGGQTGKKRRLSMIGQRRAWIAKLKNILDAPDESNYVQKLLALQGDIEHAIADLQSSDDMIKIGLQIEQGAAPPEIKPLESAFRATRDLDPRFEQLDALRDISKRIDEARAQLEGLPDKSDIEKEAEQWAAYLRRRDAELNTELDQARQTKTPALLLWTFAVAPIFAAVPAELSKWLWHYFKSQFLA